MTHIADEPALVWWAAIGAIALVAVVRVLNSAAMGAANVIVRWLGLVPGLLLAILLIGLLIWVYWQVRLDRDEHQPYVVALVASVAVIGVCTEAFSGVTAVLWREGYIGTTDTAPGLWDVEKHYLWHLADAVPLLEIPQTLHWSESRGLDDRWSGVLVLAFTILVILPVIRIGYSAYALVQEGFVHLHDKSEAKRQRKAAKADAPTSVMWEPTTISTVHIWLAALALLAVSACGYVLVRFVIVTTSPLHTWLDPLVAEDVQVGDQAIGLRWIPNVIDSTVAIAIALVAIWIIGVFVVGLFSPMAISRRSFRAGAVVVTTSTLGPAIIAATSISLALLHLGIAEAAPPVAPADELGPVLDWYAWHLADVIPVLDVPGTLNWKLPTELVDLWSGIVLLVAKVLVVGLLAWPIAALVRMTLDRARARRPRPGLLAVAPQFRGYLVETNALLTAAEQRDDGFISEIYPAKRSLERAARVARQVRALFGPGRVEDAADRALSGLADRLDELGTWPRWSGHTTDADDSDRGHRRLGFDEDLARFDEATSTALASAGTDPQLRQGARRLS